MDRLGEAVVIVGRFRDVDTAARSLDGGDCFSVFLYGEPSDSRVFDGQVICYKFDVGRQLVGSVTFDCTLIGRARCGALTSQAPSTQVIEG